MSKTIVFFGTDDFSAISLRRLIDDGFSISAVVTKPDSRKGRGRKLVAPIVKTIAEQHSIPVWQPAKMSELTDSIKKLDDPVGVLVSYGKIIPQSIIDLFNPGIINVHPSLLPLYRGPSPIETAILNGDDKTGVSIMKLSAEMDAGPVYSQVELNLDGSETSISLYETLGEMGATKLSEILPSIIDGTLLPTEQNDAEATYCKMLDKSESLLDPSGTTAEQAERKIRAHLIFPKTKLEVLGQGIVITAAEVVDQPETPLDIEFADKKHLRIKELIGPSGRSMTAEAFLNGYANPN